IRLVQTEATAGDSWPRRWPGRRAEDISFGARRIGTPRNGSVRRFPRHAHAGPRAAAGPDHAAKADDDRPPFRPGRVGRLPDQPVDGPRHGESALATTFRLRPRGYVQRLRR